MLSGTVQPQVMEKFISTNLEEISSGWQLKESKICQATINGGETLLEALRIDFVFLTEEEIKSVLETTHTKMD